MSRVAGWGRIRQDRTLNFTWNGRSYQGFEGDTLASALLASGERLLGRSFKYHRPRGVFSAGSEEPNALVSVGRGVARVPNMRATMVPLSEGLEAAPQNCWPDLRWDLLALNDLASPLLGAGFYYKTFMWPRSFWERLYEPAIRRAAGLGALSDQAHPDRSEKAYAFCDLLVIGAGPAGLRAAQLAGRAGMRVIVADEGFEPGGRLLSEREEIGGRPALDWVSDILAELEAMEHVRLMSRTTVTGAYDQGTYGALEQLDLAEGPRECFWRIVARRAVLAAGAIERPIGFAHNDRPGIMMAGAVRAYLNRWGVATGQAVTLFTNNDDAHRTARDLLEAGISVRAVVDSRADAPCLGEYRVISEARVIGTAGRRGLRQITVSSPAGTERIATDCLGVSGGWNPTVHLTCHMNDRPVWDATTASFLPSEGAVPGLEAAGSAAGHFSSKACLVSGEEVARRAVVALGGRAPKLEPLDADETAYRITPLWSVAQGKGRQWLDFQNDVTSKDVALAAREGMRSVEHLKRYTTQGMAPDQGKTSNVGALALLADATGRGIPETGTTTYRPPFVPVSISAMGAGAQGKGFAPERFTTSHLANKRRFAPMIEAGLWYRPSYFPAPDEETWQEACTREVNMVRQHVGICDVSTLGKIELQGPDVGKFLDFVYINTFSTLPVGKTRYGIMLREDGHAMDDGTTARLAEDRWVMTTTTAAAGQVMRHLEFVRQAYCAEWQLRFSSVTENWAQFAVAGPKARDLLRPFIDQDVADLPFMGCRTVTLGGVQGRLFRISFSGELAYEIAVPARYGAALYGQMLAEAEMLGGGPYGMEALNVLRIEKGFLTHAEIHGRVTATDLGFDRMMSRKKDCIGQTMAGRPGLRPEGREQLVGLRADADAEISAGAHLFAKGATATRENSQGYVTSVCESPSLGVPLGLGFLRDGRARHGEQLRLVDHLRGIETLCTVTDPVFYDPEGGRMRG